MAARSRAECRQGDWQNRLALAALLRALIDVDAAIPDIADWPALIALAAEEQVTPTLAALPNWATGAAAMPEPVRDYFEAAFFLNGTREAAMSAALTRAMAVLEPVKPVALKGAASLIAGLYPRAGARLMGDLDILVPDTSHAAALLAGAGFDPPETSPGAWVRLRHHHAPMQRDGETGTGIELHDRIATIGDPTVLAPDTVRERAETRTFAGRDMRIPSPTDRLVHTMLHDQISDRGALTGRIALRVLLEIALLARGDDLDWIAAIDAFPVGRWRNACRRVLALAGLWLGAPVPPGCQVEAEAAVSWLRRQRARPIQATAIAAHRAAGLLRAQPLALLNLLNPKWGTPRIRALLR
jgi:hypothetical protein